MKPMKSKSLSRLAGLLTLLTAATAPADVVTLQPVDDSTIGTQYPTNTADGSQFVLEFWISGYTHRPLLKFDLSSIPDGWAVLSAELTLLHNLWHPNSAPVFHTEVWRMPNDNWSEETVTWDNYDQAGGVAVALRQSQGWTNWNALVPWVWNIRIADWNYAQDLLDDAVTFETRWQGGDNFWLFTGFSSKEGTVAPTLRIEYVPILTITKTNELLIVSWPGPAAGWMLERTNVLRDVSAPWPTVSPPCQTNGDTISVTFTNTPAVGSQFFRLHKP